MRIGIGYDIHRLVENRPFILGGINIDYPLGPMGHSDGDVLCHAIMDAILGALAQGDIGILFPPQDPEYANANSLTLLKQVISLMKSQGYRVGNLDSNIICEKPKLSPFYGQIKLALSEVLDVGLENISVKARTNEKLGEVGQGEAIIAQVVVLLLTA